MRDKMYCTANLFFCRWEHRKQFPLFFDQEAMIRKSVFRMIIQKGTKMEQCSIVPTWNKCIPCRLVSGIISLDFEHQANLMDNSLGCSNL